MFYQSIEFVTYNKNMENDYYNLMAKLQKLRTTVNNFSIGKSTLGEDIWGFVLGEKTDKRPIIIQAGIHAREYITSFLLLEMIENLKEKSFDRQIIFVPIVNVDGVRICFEGYNFIRQDKQRELIKNLLKNFNKSLFKANANGVDLNVNFDANWGNGKSNVFRPSQENYIGPSPNSENEVKALINLTNYFNPVLTLSYHSKGEVIYYGYYGQSNKTKIQQAKLLKVISKTTGYQPIFTKDSAGGYKDWCLLKKDIVGFTIEVGNDNLSHPISSQYLKEIFDKNSQVVINLLKEL